VASCSLMGGMAIDAFIGGGWHRPTDGERWSSV
jgi:hypothetical protein